MHSAENVRTLVVTTLLAVGVCGAAVGAPVAFDGGWKEQGFLRLWTNKYDFRGDRLDILSDGTVSLVWRPVEPSLRDAGTASWTWQVAEGVAATDLTRKGGDDRNLAVYFVFVDAETAAGLTRNTARSLLRNPKTRALVCVWGGDHQRGAVLASPYHPGLRTKVLRTEETGRASESVDLAADYRAAFGAEPGVLVGLAVSADSDDTGGRIRASIADLMLN